MHDLNTLQRLNNEACGKGTPNPPYELRLHPKICALRREIAAFSVSANYHRWLRYALWRYAQWIIDREAPPRGEGWDDLEALQQLALRDASEASLEAMAWRS